MGSSSRIQIAAYLYDSEVLGFTKQLDEGIPEGGVVFDASIDAVNDILTNDELNAKTLNDAILSLAEEAGVGGKVKAIIKDINK